MTTKPLDHYKFNIDDFKIKKILNKGMFGIVKKAERIKDRKIFAIKNIIGRNDPQYKIHVSREIGILIQVQHPTIVRFYGFSYRDWEHKNNITIFLEFMKNGSLENYISGKNKDKLNNTQRQIILIGIARGMMILHEKNIIHRDLKPGHILLDKDYKPHITDFGQSKHFNTNDSMNQTSEGIGTSNYMAPEVFKEDKFDAKADVYSFGILMYELVTGKDTSKEWKGQICQQEAKIMNGRRPGFEDVSIKKGLRNMIEKCWDQDPKERPSFSEIFKKLCLSTDPYLLGFDDNLEKEKIVDCKEEEEDEEEEKKEFDDDDEEEEEDKNIIKLNDVKINIKYCLKMNKEGYKKVMNYVNEITIGPKSIDNIKIEELKDEIEKLKQKTNEQEETFSKMKTKPFDHYKLNIDDFKIDKKFISNGKIGIVKKAKRRKDEKIFAIKNIIEKNDPQYKIHVLREIRILIQVQHPTIVRFYGFSYRYWNRKN